MANSAFDHTAAITLPGSSTNTGIVTWSGTGANTLLDSTVLVSGNNITIPGTITLGGTAITSTAAEINLLDALDRGSILYGNASGATAVLGQGSNGQVLTSDGTDISWENASAGATLSGSTDNTVVTVTGANAMAGEANLTFDGTKLGINTAAPDSGQYLHIVGANGSISGLTATTTSQMTVENNSNAAISILSPAADFGAIYFGDADSNIAGGLIYNHGATRLDVRVEGSTKYILAPTLMTIPGGINFPDTQVASADANTLDDYEEGTFTPIVDQAWPHTTNGMGHATQFGHYTKIGNRVFFNLRVILNGNGDAGNVNVSIRGLPFTCDSTANSETGFIVGYSSGLNMHVDDIMTAVTDANVQAKLNLRQPQSDGSWQSSGLTRDELSTDATLNIAGMYEVD